MYGLYTLTRKEIQRFLRIWKQTLLPPIITTVLYLLIFWKFIWERIGEIGDVSYINFIFPWLIMMAVIINSYGNSSSSFFGGKFQKSIEELFVSPMSTLSILLWYVLWAMARWILIWILVFLTGFFMTDIAIHSYFYMFVFLILTSALFSLAGLFNAIFAKSFDDVNVIPSFVITPMIYLGWVFYSIEFLSDFWQTVSQFNPILYMVNGLRYAFIGQSDVNVFISIAILLIFITLLTLLNLHFLRKWYGIKS